MAKINKVLVLKLTSFLITLILILFLSCLAIASNGGAQFKSLFLGSPYAGFRIEFYEAGTVTPKDVWLNEDKSIAVQQVTADSKGMATFYADGTYRMIIKTASGVGLYDWDNVKITSDTATMWEGNFGTFYPAATTANRWQLFAKVTANNEFRELGINIGSQFIPITPIVDLITDSTFLGESAGTSAIEGAISNTLIGALAGQSITTGKYNTAVGKMALGRAQTMESCTAVGYYALHTNNGNDNTGIGVNALYSNTTGINNTAVGTAPMFYNTTGMANVAVGRAAMRDNNGNYNTAVGHEALEYNQSGNNNTSVGYIAGRGNTTGSANVSVGNYAGQSNSIGNSNTLVGYYAGTGVPNNSFSNNTFLGRDAGTRVTTGSNNVLLGMYAGDDISSGSNNIIIGYDVDADSATSNNQLNIAGLIKGTIGVGGMVNLPDVYPLADNTYYLGKNSATAPFAWKGVILKDTVNGRYYRLQISNGALEVVGL